MLFLNFALYPSEMGALTQLWGATSPEGAKFGRKVRASLPFLPLVPFICRWS
jgi:hypothetical protein